MFISLLNSKNLDMFRAQLPPSITGLKFWSQKVRHSKSLINTMLFSVSFEERQAHLQDDNVGLSKVER